MDDICLEAEVRLARGTHDEETFVRRIVFQEAIAKLLIDLIVMLARYMDQLPRGSSLGARRSAPSRRAVESVTPASAPRQPACAAATTPAS